MKVVKPNELSVLTRCFEHQRSFHLGVSVLLLVPLSDALVLLPEVALWKLVAERMGPLAMLEPGMPKSRGELLVDGACFCPEGVPRTSLPVRVQVGAVDKTLLVHGDRYWTPSRTPSEPQPFTTMPLRWERAYGGPKLARNPLGRGHGESTYMGQRVQLLPNLEDPAAPVLTPRDRPEPVGLGPIDPSWPQRRSRAGTYDRRWLETGFPGPAHDIDWRYFNLAPDDQQIEGFWRGDETYRLDHLHPTRPCIEGRLPPVVARAFVTRSVPAPPDPPADESAPPDASADGSAPPQGDTGPAVGLEEVTLSLRTLWLLPDAERAVLIFQGTTPIRSDDGTDVAHLVVAAEHRERPRPAEHYAQALEDRLDPEQGILAALRVHELLPEGMAEVVDDDLAAERALHETQRRLEHNLHRRAQQEHEEAVARLRALGQDPDAFGLEPPRPPPPMPSPDELPALVEQLQADAQARQAEEEARMDQQRDQLRGRLDALGMDPQERDRLLSLHERGPTGPPTFTAEGQRAALRELVEQSRRMGADTTVLEQMLADPESLERWRKAEVELQQAYRRHAHLQDPAPAMSPARSEEARAFVRQALERGEDFAEFDLTGADLTGMDLRGAALSGALLESARLDGADLRDADLRGAVLAHASLVSAKLDGATLVETNLGRARLERASAIEADLHDAELMGADLRDAVLRGATLTGVGLLQADLRGADLGGVRAETLLLVETEVAGISLSRAVLPRATFVKVDLQGADLSHATLRQATFVTCHAPGVSFAGADLSRARFVDRCVLDRANFAAARLIGSNLRGTAMPGCDLRTAILDAADLSETDLREAKLHRAVAREARLDKADLRDASAIAINLMHASLIGADIRGLDLRGSNLHGADMARVRSDARVRLEDALLTRVRIHPVLDPQAAPELAPPPTTPPPTGGRP